MSDMNSSGDSSELEALFDSVASSSPFKAPVKPPSSLMKQARESDGMAEDSDELQTLFDSIVNEVAIHNSLANEIEQGVALVDSMESDAEWPAQDKVFQQVGQMARQLHDALGALGYDKLLEKTVHALPDAQDRLAYIANLTEQAACKVLNATDVATPLQDDLEQNALALGEKWNLLFANQMGVEEFKILAADTRDFLNLSVLKKTSATKEQLMEIMMAQDFQDLTGQVIKKIVSLAQDVESQLMKLLIETMPGEKKTESVTSLLNGPVINAEGRTDVVASQQQVDDLLDSLGF